MTVVACQVFCMSISTYCHCSNLSLIIGGSGGFLLDNDVELVWVMPRQMALFLHIIKQARGGAKVYRLALARGWFAGGQADILG